jgi:hypothetical protein
LRIQRDPSIYALRDSDILKLLAALPKTTMGRRYGFAFQLMATYGLQAADLRYLQVRNHETELWLRARRHDPDNRASADEPSLLEALQVFTDDGIPQQWNLVARVAAGERLPPLGHDADADQHLHDYLKNRPVWREIQSRASRSEQQAVMGSFCQRHACTADNRCRSDEPI